MTQTEPVTPHTENLQKLITSASCVLFDFDGPICRLFAGHAADRVSRELVDWLEAYGLHGLLSDEERTLRDPLDVLRAVDRRRPRSDLVAELEEQLTQEELKAAASAMPTPYADPVIRTWTALGAQLAVTTNNSPRTVRKYLESRGLETCFGPHLYGRTRDVRLLKPHPHGLNQALATLGVNPADALMVGDAPTDLTAAREAGVAFLGYARNERKEKILRDAGAEDLVVSLEPVVQALVA